MRFMQTPENDMCIRRARYSVGQRRSALKEALLTPYADPLRSEAENASSLLEEHPNRDTREQQLEYHPSTKCQAGTKYGSS